MKLPKYNNSSEQQIIREFVPTDPERARSAGRVIVRASNYGGISYKKTYGLEVSIPEGHVIPEEYARRAQVEYTL
jgi:hypothetical protein